MELEKATPVVFQFEDNTYYQDLGIIYVNLRRHVTAMATMVALHQSTSSERTRYVRVLLNQEPQTEHQGSIIDSLFRLGDRALIKKFSKIVPSWNKQPNKDFEAFIFARNALAHCQIYVGAGPAMYFPDKRSGQYIAKLLGFDKAPPIIILDKGMLEVIYRCAITFDIKYLLEAAEHLGIPYRTLPYETDNGSNTIIKAAFNGQSREYLTDIIT